MTIKIFDPIAGCVELPVTGVQASDCKSG
nr:hypothetical protein [Pseudomonas sp. PGPR40]